VPLVASAFLALASVAGPQDSARPPEPELPLKVDRAIARALRWLEQEQRPDGTWPGHESDHPGGVTALVCLARWKAGVPRTDPALVRGLGAIASTRFQTTYSAAVHLMLGAALRETPSPTTTVAAFTDASLKESFDFLVGAQVEGVWAYPSGPVDVSNTQFALLGLRAGSKLGFEVPSKTLERAAAAMFRWQTESGAFVYREGEVGRGGETAATLGGFAVIAELGRKNPNVEGVLAKRKDRLKKTEAWLEARFDVARPAYGDAAWTSSWQYAWLWAVERWCGLAGKARIGAHDWYAEGAAYLVEHQMEKGDWEGSVESTCFALLFLRRATMTGWEDRSETFRRLDAESRDAAKAAVTPAPEVPRISDWLLAGPYTQTHGIASFQTLDLSKLRPRTKETFEGRAFERVQLSAEGWSDLEKVTGRGGDHMTWILATQLVWEPPEPKAESKSDAKAGAASDRALEARLWFAFEDPWKVWLDGKLVSTEMRVASPIVEDFGCAVRLEPGAHALVVLVDDEVGASVFSARITTPTGKALPRGFRVEAAPGAPVGPKAK
jgi:hypothetical protein